MGMTILPTEALSPNLRRSIAAYDEHPGYFEQRFAAVDTADLREKFVDTLPPGRNLIIDAGCGTGRDLRGFATLGVTALGIDLSSQLLAVADGAAPLIRADFRSMPLADASIAGVWSMASLVHLTKHESLQALREFARVVGAHCPVFISVMAGATGQWLDGGGGPRWFTGMTPNDIQVLAEAAGLELASIAPSQGSIGGRWLNASLRKR